MTSPDGILIGSAVISGLVLGWWALPISALAIGGLRLIGLAWPWWKVALIVTLVALGAVRGGDGVDTGLSGPILASTAAEGEIVSMPVALASSNRAVVAVSRVSDGDTWTPVRARVLVYLPPDSEITVGDRLWVTWNVSSLTELPPGTRGFVASEGASGMATAFAAKVIEESTRPRRHLVSVRQHLAERLQRAVPGDAGALISGIVTGDDSALSAEARQDFADTGTGHVTAVSGSNIAMLLALWGRAIPRSRSRRHPVLALAIIGSVWLYCGMTGLQPSAVRAAGFATFLIAAGRFGRRADPVTALFLSTAILMLIEPGYAESVGFWLSTVASLALVGSFNPGYAGTWRDNVRSTTIGLIAAQFATMPIVIWTFGTVTPIGLLANLLLAPVMAVAFPVSFLYSGIVWMPALNQALAPVPGVICDIALSLTRRLAMLAPAQSIDVTTPIQLALVVLPCAGFVLLFNRDVHRWVPRWRALAAEHVGQIVLGAAAAVVGSVAMLLIVTIWPS